MTLAAMRDLPKFPEVQLRGCQALASFAKGDSLDTRVADEGGIEAAVAAMKAFEENAGVQEAGCEALAAIGRLNEVEESVAAAGGVLSFMMRGGSGLAALTQRDGNDVRVATAGELSLSAASLSPVAHQLPGVAPMRCLLFCFLCIELLNCTRRSHTLYSAPAPLLLAGGISVCLAALRAHPKNSGVVSAACAALCTMTASQSNKAKAAQAGAIEAAFAAAKAFPDDADIQVRGRPPPAADARRHERSRCGCLREVPLAANSR